MTALRDEFATTRCWLDTCRDVAHVILYASSDKFASLQTRPRQPVAFCLAHGGHIYDAIRWERQGGRTDRGRLKLHSATHVCPNWLVADLRNGRLPRTSPDPNGWPAASALATSKRWSKR